MTSPESHGSIRAVDQPTFPDLVCKMRAVPVSSDTKSFGMSRRFNLLRCLRQASPLVCLTEIIDPDKTIRTKLQLPDRMFVAAHRTSAFDWMQSRGMGR
jgi:hypothetical protein